jgi:hypothetical protein
MYGLSAMSFPEIGFCGNGRAKSKATVFKITARPFTYCDEKVAGSSHATSRSRDDCLSDAETSFCTTPGDEERGHICGSLQGPTHLDLDNL